MAMGGLDLQLPSPRRNFFNQTFSSCKAKEIQKTKKILGHVLKNLPLIAGFLVPLALVCQRHIISNCYDHNSFQARKPTGKGRTIMSA